MAPTVSYVESPFDQIVSISFGSGYFVMFGLTLSGATPLGTSNVSAFGSSHGVTFEINDPAKVPVVLPVNPTFPFPGANEAISGLVPQSAFTKGETPFLNTIIIPFIVSGQPISPFNGIPFINGEVDCFVYKGKPKSIVPNFNTMSNDPHLVGFASISIGNATGGTLHFPATQPANSLTAFFKIIIANKAVTVTVTS